MYINADKLLCIKKVPKATLWSVKYEGLLYNWLNLKFKEESELSLIGIRSESDWNPIGLCGLS